MSDTTPNTPTVEELSASVAKLEKSLEAERAAHKATKEAAKQAADQFRARIASGFGLDPAASEDTAILSRITDTTAEVSALKSAAEASAVDSALREAFAASGAVLGHYEDFHNLAAEHFHFDPKTGKVVSKPDAPTPNVDPATWCVVELRQRRSAWFPLSQGAGARGAGFTPGRVDDAMYDPRSPQYNFTAQLAHEAKYGPAAADAARAKYRGRGGAAW